MNKIIELEYNCYIVSDYSEQMGIIIINLTISDLLGACPEELGQFYIKGRYPLRLFKFKIYIGRSRFGDFEALQLDYEMNGLCG